MPLPKPNNNEDFDSWMDRCFKDPKMQDKFSERSERVAVCSNLWNHKAHEDIEKINQNINKAKHGFANRRK